MDGERNEACKEKFNSLQKDIDSVKDLYGREIKEIKTHNKWQDNETRSMNKFMATISEAIVEMKVLNENMQKLLIQNSEKIQSIDDKIEKKIEKTDKRIDTVREEIKSQALESHLKILPMIKGVLPNLIVLGILFLLMTLLQSGI